MLKTKREEPVCNAPDGMSRSEHFCLNQAGVFSSCHVPASPAPVFGVVLGALPRTLVVVYRLLLSIAQTENARMNSGSECMNPKGIALVSLHRRSAAIPAQP